MLDLWGANLDILSNICYVRVANKSYVVVYSILWKKETLSPETHYVLD